MINFAVIYLCNLLLFMFLLDDKYRFISTILSSAAVYIVSLLASGLLRAIFSSFTHLDSMCIIVNSIILFCSSLLLYQNNFLQKLYVAALCISNYYFIVFFSVQLMGLLPVSTAGIFAAIFSLLLYLIFSMIIGLCLYSPIHHFSDRSPSGFMLVSTLVQLSICLVVTGKLDFLYKSNAIAGRTIFSILIYALIIFSFRSIYHGAKFREGTAKLEIQNKLLGFQLNRYVETNSLLNAHKRLIQEDEYVLDAVTVMIKEGAGDKVPAYIAETRENRKDNILAKNYHSNLYINSILANYAAFCADHGIVFESNVTAEFKAFPISDICMITDEVLNRACSAAAKFQPEPRVRYSLFPMDEMLKIEAIYSTVQEDATGGLTFKAMRKKSLSEILALLFTDSSDAADDLGLSFTKDFVNSYSGTLDIFSTEDDTILRAMINYS